MKVTYNNPAIGLYVLEGEHLSPPIMLANLDDFSVEHCDCIDPVEGMLCRSLLDEHYVVTEVGGFSYVAKREGITIMFAQVLRTDEYSHGQHVLGEALDAVIKYEGN